MRSSGRLPLLAAAALALSACGGEAPDSIPAEVRSDPDRVAVERSADHTDDVANLEDRPRDSLQLRRTLGDEESFGRVVAIEAFPGWLAVADLAVPPFIKAVDLESGRDLSAIGREGEGPGEFASPRSLARLPGTPPRLQVYDYRNRRLSTIQFTPDGRTPELVRQRPVRTDDVLLFHAPVTRGYVATGAVADHSLLHVDSAGTSTKLWAHPPYAAGEVSSGELRERNLADVASPPGVDRLAVAYHRANRIDLFEAPRGPFVSIAGPAPIEGLAQRDSVGYGDVAVTERAVYGLLRHCAGERCGEGPLPRRVHVFDWEGAYRGEVVLDRGVYAMEVAGDSLLWGPIADPVPRIGEWELPEWVAPPPP